MIKMSYKRYTRKNSIALLMIQFHSFTYSVIGLPKYILLGADML